MDPISIAFGLAQAAPAVLRWITGSAQAEQAATAVLEVAKQVTGRADPADAVAAINADPALVLRFRQRIAEMSHEMDLAFLADRADARKRDVALVQAGQRNVRADVMVALDVLGLIACLVILALYRQALPGEAVGIISTVAGIFGACLRDAHQFEFGSSRGSQNKDELLARKAEGG